MPEWAWLIVVGVSVGILAPPIKWLFHWVTRAIAHQIGQEVVFYVNDKLGLSAIREDVSKIEKDVHQIDTRLGNVEQQVETLLTDQ